MGAEQSSQVDLEKASSSIHFHLYNDPSKLQCKNEIVIGDKISLASSRYNSNYSLTLLVHGFNNSYEGSFLQTTKNALLRQKIPTNIIMMDYRQLSRVGLINFPAVLPYIPSMCDKVMEFLLFLMDSGVLSGVNDVHLIGESLGAQICGITGKKIQEIKSEKIKRITGLDPAGPIFQDEPEKFRLCPSDATFVDVVHSNQGVLGYIGAIGHVDFYLNGGGPIQPKYKKNHDPGWIGLDRNDLSHAFAVELYTESILKKKMYYGCGCFHGQRLCDEFEEDVKNCSDSTIFGYETPSSARGEYFVKALD